MSVLVVDDEPDLLLVTSLLLGRAGVETLSASDGAAALDLYREHASEVDLVITDEYMPRMRGTALRERLAELAPELPVHVWSCLPDPRTGVAPKEPNRVAGLLGLARKG